MAFTVDFGDGGLHSGQHAGGRFENDARVDARPLARSEHHPPIVGRGFFEQQDFKLSAAGGVDPAQACRDHFGIISNEHISGLKRIQQPGELVVRDFSRVASQHEQARLVALGGWHLGDQFRGQFTSKVARAHGWL